MPITRRNNTRMLGSQGPVLLDAHGFGCSQKMWGRITPAFADSPRQILFDCVGCGQSDLAAFDARRYASLNGYAQDVLDVCDAYGLISGVTFVGHSVSCSAGMLASIARPELFERLVLIGPSPCFLNDPPHYMGGFEHEDLDGLPSLMDQNYIGWAHDMAPVEAGADDAGQAASELSDSFCSTESAVTRVFARTTFFADNRADLPRVTRPCLILQHGQDTLAPLAVGEYRHAHLRGSTLQVLPVAGHCSHMTHPQLGVDAMRSCFGGA